MTPPEEGVMKKDREVVRMRQERRTRREFTQATNARCYAPHFWISWRIEALKADTRLSKKW